MMNDLEYNGYLIKECKKQIAVNKTQYSFQYQLKCNQHHM